MPLFESQVSIDLACPREKGGCHYDSDLAENLYVDVKSLYESEGEVRFSISWSPAELWPNSYQKSAIFEVIIVKACNLWFLGFRWQKIKILGFRLTLEPESVRIKSNSIEYSMKTTWILTL